MKHNLHIRTLQPQDMQSWDEYVDHHPEGTFFHLTGWFNVISSVFDHKPHYLLAIDEAMQKIVGVLPLFEQRSRFFGHTLISTPFCVYGGVVADSDEIRKALEKKAYELGCFLKVDYIELRNKEAYSLDSPWQSHCHHATFFSTVKNTPDEILTSIKRKQRAVIRHALNNELTWSNQDNIQDCYDIYAKSVHGLGTPVFDSKLFYALKEEFATKCETLIIKDQNQAPVSSVLSFYYKNTVLPYYGGGVPQARQLKSNDYMYYKLMCLANEKGSRQFDFGRSKENSGAYHYKKNWGMQEKKLHYRIALVKAKHLPNLSPNNPKYKLFIQLWKKLPHRISRKMGPQLSKFLG